MIKAPVRASTHSLVCLCLFALLSESLPARCVVSGAARQGFETTGVVSADVKKKTRAAKPRRRRGGEPLTGSWGGRHISLVSTGEGADVEFDCAHARIDGPVLLGRDDCFEANGSYTKEHGGPLRPGEQLRSESARFSGCVRGGVMNLSITFGGGAARTYTLVRGQSPRITKCM